MSHSTTMTIRLEPKIKSRLEKLSAATRRSKSFLAAEAVREFIEVNEWQIEDIKKAIKEADADDFASDREVRAVFHRWGIDGD
ncbi:MAG: CopG family ribbon-helix-helix protein [Halocynthiibacter sp.]